MYQATASRGGRSTPGSESTAGMHIWSAQMGEGGLAMGDTHQEISRSFWHLFNGGSSQVCVRVPVLSAIISAYLGLKRISFTQSGCI
jgi:hypothetical protein